MLVSAVLLGSWKIYILGTERAKRTIRPSGLSPNQLKTVLPHAVSLPSLSKLGDVATLGSSFHQHSAHRHSVDVQTSFIIPHPGRSPGSSTSPRTCRLDLNSLMTASVESPREGVRPETYPCATLTKNRHPTQSDPMELTIERMGEFPTATNDLEIERFQEYVVCAMGGFGSFATALGAGCDGPELAGTSKRQSSTHRELLSRQGIRVP